MIKYSLNRCTRRKDCIVRLYCYLYIIINCLIFILICIYHVVFEGSVFI